MLALVTNDSGKIPNVIRPTASGGMESSNNLQARAGG